MILIQKKLYLLALSLMAFFVIGAQLEAATINGRVYRATDGSGIPGSPGSSSSTFSLQVYDQTTDLPVWNQVAYPPGENRFTITVYTQVIRIRFFVGGSVVAVLENIHGNLSAFTQNIDVVVQPATVLGACMGVSCANYESCQSPCVEAVPCSTCQPCPSCQSCASPRCGRFLRCRR